MASNPRMFLMRLRWIGVRHEVVSTMLPVCGVIGAVYVSFPTPWVCPGSHGYVRVLDAEQVFIRRRTLRR